MAQPSDRPPNDQREVRATDPATERNGGGTTRRGTVPPERDRDVAVTGNGHAIAALVLGLFAATYAFFGFTAIAAIIFGIAAIGFGVKGMSIAKDHGGLHKGLAISGIVSGALGLLLGIAVIVGALTLGQQIDTEDLPPEVQDIVDDVTS